MPIVDPQFPRNWSQEPTAGNALALHIDRTKAGIPPSARYLNTCN